MWNACGTRKAPLGALDSSSSGSSDSDDDEDNDRAKAATEPTAQEPGKDRAAPARWEGISVGWDGPGLGWPQVVPVSPLPWAPCQVLPLVWHRMY